MTTITQDTEVTRKVTKVSFGKNGGVIVTFEQTRIIMVEGKPVEQIFDIPAGGRSLPHPDLLHAFELLRGHLAIVCWQLDGKKPILPKIEDDEEFISDFKVTGFSLGGSDEHEGVCLIGSRKIKRGVLNLVSPFTKFYDETNPYEYADELNHLITHAVEEAILYLDGKIAPSAQQELPFSETGGEDLE